MNSDLWPGTHSVPFGGGGEGGEAPLSIHSQCFIYGPLHFWLWWLQYLSSYLNCIFKDFIQYLHAIEYELSFLFANLFFFWFCYLIVFTLACVVIFHKQTCPLNLILAWCCYGGCSPYVFVYLNSDDSWTQRSRCRKIFAGRAKRGLPLLWV